MLNMDRLREWLINKGIPEKELDEFIETPIIRDIGEGLALSLMNDDSIGEMVVMIMMQLDDIQMRLEKLEGGN